MSSESPAAILYSSDGYELATISGSAIPANTRGILVEGSDGTNAHFITMDSSGRPVIVGAGVAGTPTGGVVTVQGVTGGTVLPVSFTAQSATAAAPPASAVYIGASVTTAAPTYTTGQMDPLSLTTTGLLRIDGVYPVNATTPTSDIAFVGGAVTTAAPAYTTGQLSALSLTTVGNLRVDGSSVTQPVAGTGTAGTPAGGVLTVQGSATGTPIPVSGTFTTDKSSTGTITSVAASVVSVTALASNVARVGASFYNDGGSMLYLALSASAASLTAFSIRIMPNSYYDLPVDYTGQVNAIWNGVLGSVRVTEFT